MALYVGVNLACLLGECASHPASVPRGMAVCAPRPGVKNSYTIGHNLGLLCSANLFLLVLPASKNSVAAAAAASRQCHATRRSSACC